MTILNIQHENKVNVGSSFLQHPLCASGAFMSPTLGHICVWSARD